MSSAVVRRLFLRPGVAHRLLRRSNTTATSGAILSKPEAVRFGVWRILAVAFPGIYGGAMAAKYVAAWLEEYNVFVPDDDDD